MNGIGVISGVALECRDPAALAQFYSSATGWPIVFASEDWVSIGEGPDSLHLSFQRAPGYAPPVWPDPASSMQVHLHLRVADLDAAEEALLALGATKFEAQPHPDTSRVLADPEGHVFCVCPARR
jgi:predicted enzyme related to lactoylglutathione lyase